MVSHYFPLSLPRHRYSNVGRDSIVTREYRGIEVDPMGTSSSIATSNGKQLVDNLMDNPFGNPRIELRNYSKNFLVVTFSNRL